MRGLRLAIGTTLLAAAVAPTTSISPARADGFPYCISGDSAGGGSSVSNCNFVTFRQCQHSARNTGGSCVRNPYYAYGYGPAAGYGPAVDNAYAMAPADGVVTGYTVVVPAPSYGFAPSDY